MGQYNVALDPHQVDLISNRDVKPNWPNVGPAPKTTSQHYADIGSMPRFIRDTKRHKPPVGVLRLGQSALVKVKADFF